MLAIFSVFTALAFAQGPCNDQEPIAGSEGWMTCGGLTNQYRYECHADGTMTDDGQYCCCDRYFTPDGSGTCQECPKEIHNYCEWVGTAPYCNSDETSCPSGYTPVALAQNQREANEWCAEMAGFVSHLQRPMHPTCPGFGNACDGTLFGTVTGQKVYCCNLPSNYLGECEDDFAGARVAAALHGFPDLKSCLNVYRYRACTDSRYEDDARRYCPRTCGFCD